MLSPVIHRDLTPDNIIVSPTGEVFVVDFGAANEFLTEATGTLIGQQGYMSPEQIRGKATPASDYYSLGCVVYYALTGEDPPVLSTCRLPEHHPARGSTLAGIVERLTTLDSDSRLRNRKDIEEEFTMHTVAQPLSLSSVQEEISQ